MIKNELIYDELSNKKEFIYNLFIYLIIWFCCMKIYL